MFSCNFVGLFSTFLLGAIGSLTLGSLTAARMVGFSGTVLTMDDDPRVASIAVRCEASGSFLNAKRLLGVGSGAFGRAFIAVTAVACCSLLLSTGVMLIGSCFIRTNIVSTASFKFVLGLSK